MPPPFLIVFFTISASLTSIPRLSEILLPAMAALHLHLFQPSIVDESEICKLVVNHFLPDRVVLQCRPPFGEDPPPPPHPIQMRL
jgi:hypothetical protein